MPCDSQSDNGDAFRYVRIFVVFLFSRLPGKQTSATHCASASRLEAVSGSSSSSSSRQAVCLL